MPREPYKLHVKNSNGEEIPVIVDPDMENHEVYFKLGDMELLLPSMEGLILGRTLMMFSEYAGVEEES